MSGMVVDGGHDGLGNNFHFHVFKKEPLMCFRPGGVTKAQQCPKCGKKLAMLGGVKQKICPFCKTPLTEEQKPEETKPPEGQ